MVLKPHSGAGLGIQNCGCKVAFKSSFGKSVGADLNDSRGIKGFSQKSVGAVAPTAPTLTRPLSFQDCIQAAVCAGT